MYLQKVVLYVEEDEHDAPFEPEFPGDFRSPVWIEFQGAVRPYDKECKIEAYDAAQIRQDLFKLLETWIAKRKTFYIHGIRHKDENDCLVFDFSPKGTVLDGNDMVIWRGTYQKYNDKCYFEENITSYEALLWLGQQIQTAAKCHQKHKSNITQSDKFLGIVKAIWHGDFK